MRLAILFAAAFWAAGPAIAADEFPRTCNEIRCSFDADGTGLRGIVVLRGWTLEEPYLYETAGGARASVPTVHLRKGDDFVILNGRQIVGAHCESSRGEEICVSKPVSEAAGAQAIALAKWRRPKR